MNSKLLKLSMPFPQSYQKKSSDGYGNYIPHAALKQRVLEVLGYYNITKVEPIRGYAPEIVGRKKTWPAVENAIVGALVTVEFQTNPPTTIVECGEVKSPAMKGHDGERLKGAISDGFRRACANIGLGLHMWSTKTPYTLYTNLQVAAEEEEISNKVGQIINPPPTREEITEIVKDKVAERPYSAEDLRAKFVAALSQYKGNNPTYQVVASHLVKLIPDETDRYAFTRYITGNETGSTKSLTPPQLFAFSAWFVKSANLGFDDTINEHCQAEANAAVIAAQKAEGQQELL